MIALVGKSFKNCLWNAFPFLLTKTNKHGKKCDSRKKTLDSSYVVNNDFTGCCQMFFSFLAFVSFFHDNTTRWRRLVVWLVFEVSFNGSELDE